MSVRKQESFMRGALMLSVAALVSRLLGAFYKPIVARIFAPYDGSMGAAGLGLTQVPLSTYQIIFSFTSVGLNVGISRLVAERMALGDPYGAKRVFRLSLTVMTTLGLISSLVLYFGAPWIARLIGEEALETIPGFRAMAPALLITAWMAAYRGLFQGFQRMTPNAVSQIVEQIIRVSSGILLTYLVLRQTGNVALGAAGFNFGDVLGAVAGLLYLLALARRSGAGMWEVPLEAPAAERPARRSRHETAGQLIRRIFSVAGPIALSGAVVPLMMMADTFFVFRLVADPDAQYGMLTNAFMIAYLPAVFTSAIYTSILPAMTEAMARGEVQQAQRRASLAYRMTFLLAVPAQAGLYILSSELYALLFGDRTGGAVMAAISWAVVPIMLQQTTSGVLQGIGKIVLPVRNFLIGALVKMILSALWTGPLGIEGAAYATAVGFAVAAFLNLCAVERLLGRIIKTRNMLFKPVAAALAMAAVIALLRAPLGRLPVNAHLVSLLLVGIGGVIYGLTLLPIGGVRRQDLEALPGGRSVATLLARTRLLR